MSNAPGIVGGLIKAVEAGRTEGVIELREGTYAIGFYIDKNQNEKIDTNFLGIPKEQFLGSQMMSWESSALLSRRPRSFIRTKLN